MSHAEFAKYAEARARLRRPISLFLRYIFGAPRIAKAAAYPDAHAHARV